MRFIYNHDKISSLYNIKWMFFFQKHGCVCELQQKNYVLHCKKNNYVRHVRTLSLSAINLAVNIDILLKGARCMMTSPTGTSSRQYRNTFGFG